MKFVKSIVDFVIAVILALGVSIVTVLFAIVGGVMCLPIFKKKYCLFSRFEGVLTFEGKPISGVRIVRKMLRDDKTNDYRIAEEVTTNERGEFKFDSRWDKIYIPPLLEHRVFQRVFAEVIIWDHAKAFKEEYADFGGEYENLVCELTDEDNIVDTEQTPVFFVGSKCQWDVVKSFDFIKHS